jgi:hypothetical protein
MRRKSILLVLGIVVLVVATVLTTLALLARHEPRFWREAAVPAGKKREDQSTAFKKELLKLLNAIDNHYPQPEGTFTEAQINSFLEEDFVKEGHASKFLPDNVTTPRVVLQQDKIRLAFRYGNPPWSTVISIDFRIWLVPNQCNVVVLELQSLHAGALPISAQSLLEQLSEILRKRNIDVTWYRHNANPAAVLRFQTDQPRPTVQLQRLELRNGMLWISARSIDPASTSSTRPVSAPQGN